MTTSRAREEMLTLRRVREYDDVGNEKTEKWRE